SCDPVDTPMVEKSKLDEDKEGKVWARPIKKHLLQMRITLVSKILVGVHLEVYVGNKIHKAFPLPGESSHWQYKFPQPVKVVPT
nr:hypothetical protein [Tanacetum cinerariifolium]